jgi:hypothetical protein
MTSQKKVAEIKADICAGLKQSEIAKTHKVSRSLVSDIATDRVHKNVPWPEDAPVKKPGGQRKKIEGIDPTNRKILELESEIVHLTQERNTERKKVKASAKTEGLFRAMVREMEQRIVPMKALPPIRHPQVKKAAIEEHVVMHLSDGHHDQVVTLEESQGLEKYDFPISCARAERYVDTVIDWTQGTLSPKFNFKVLWIAAYGDHTSGEIHGHGNRSYYRNQFKNCLAIGRLHSLMIRDLAPHFDQVNIIYLSGNHGRRSIQKDYHGAQDNFDYLIGEITRLHCRDITNAHFTIPNAYSINVDINGVGFNFSHGDDVKGNLGIPFYGMVRRQKGLIALNSMMGRRIQYYVMGHHHTLSSLSDMDGELVVNGAWPATDSYSINSFAGYREPSQLLHGVNPKYGITWRMNVKLKHENERLGPKRYLIDGGRDVGPL